MEATFNFKIDALNEEFITKLKAMFSKNASIEFTITDKNQSDTDYLLSTEANKEMLQKSIQQFEEGKMINKTLEELLKW